MGAPSYDDETLAAYFQPVAAITFADAVAGPVLRQLAREEPDVIAAVADVDRSQIREALARSPEERLTVAFQLAATLSELRRGAR